VDAHLLGLDHQPGALVPRHLVLAGLFVRYAVVLDVVPHWHIALWHVLAVGYIPHGPHLCWQLWLVGLFLLGLFLLLALTALDCIANGALEPSRTTALGGRYLIAILWPPAIIGGRLTAVVAA